MPKWLWELILMMLLKASPELKAVACKKLDELEEAAKKTANPWDDMLVKMAKGIAGCPPK